jgi:hypothetical protein
VLKEKKKTKQCVDIKIHLLIKTQIHPVRQSGIKENRKKKNGNAARYIGKRHHHIGWNTDFRLA